MPSPSNSVPARGFSLVEMIVVVGIFTAVSAILLSNYPSFSHKISVQNLAHQIGISIRQAQVFGLSVREAAAGTAIFPGFGVYFSMADPSSFVIYTDRDNDRHYDYAGVDCSAPSNLECIETVRIASGDNIKDLCVYDSNNVEKCVVGPPQGTVSELNIVFVRPDPDAIIVGTYNSIDTVYPRAVIKVEPPQKNFYKSVTVWATGQISVQ